MGTAAPRSAPPPRRVGQRADADLLRRQPLITLAAAASAGILCGDRIPTSVVLLMAPVAAIAGWWLSSNRGFLRCSTADRFPRSNLAWGAVLLTFIGLFATVKERTSQRLERSTLNPFLSDRWQPIVLEATITDRVEMRPDRLAELYGNGKERKWQSIFGVAVQKLRIRDRWQTVSGNARVIAAGDCTARMPGDEVRIFGKIQAIPPPRNPGGIDVRDTYRARGQVARIRVDGPKQILMQDRSSLAPHRFLAAVGTAGESLLTRQLGEDTGPLAAALILGRREAVDRDTREKLLETGTAHLLSVSGMHLGMVAVATTWLLALTGVSRYRQIAIVLLICAIYAALTGGRPPVLRAALIVTAVLIGMWTGRLVHPLNALAFAALTLLLINPENLHSVGVHLSFVAVATLVFASRHVATTDRLQQWQRDPLDRFLDSYRRRWLSLLRTARFKIWQALQLSFWVWIITAPLVWLQFHIITPIAIPANVALAFPLLIALISGLATVALGLLWEPLAILPGLCCQRTLEVMIQWIERLAALPCGHFWLPAPPSWWVAVFYLSIAAGFLIPKTRRRSRWLIGWIVLWFGIALPLATMVKRRVMQGLPASTLEVVFIDVGHGTSVLIRHPDGGDWLYDCGRLGDPSESARPIEAVLWHRGIRHLDGVILSHADSDHYNALPALLRRFSVGRVITAPQMLATDEAGLIAVREAIASSSVSVVEKSSGDVLYRKSDPLESAISWGSILHPPKHPIPGSDNAHSLVLRIDHGGRTLLLPGDIAMPGTEHLLRVNRPPPGGILMAPHHGSLQEDIRPVLDWCRPATIVVSGNDRADRAAVRQSLIQTGASLHITAAVGAITIWIDAEGEVSTERWLDQTR